MFGRATIRLGIGPHSSCLFMLIDSQKKKKLVFVVALWNKADHYIFALWFLSSSFFLLFSSPNLSRRRLDVCHTSTQFECQGRRSKVKVTRDKKRAVHAHHPSSVRMVRARCKRPHAAADGTIPSLPGVISAACVWFMFGRTSSAAVCRVLHTCP